MSLRAASYLGDNTIAILDEIVAALRARGVDITVDGAAGRTSPDARAHAHQVDLIWMCGSLAAALLADGTLDHEVIGAPVFAGETEAVYRSVLVVRSDGPTKLGHALDGRVGINEHDSWTDHHGLRSFLGHAAPDRWFADELVTGSHRASIDAVAHGRCDVVSIDQTIWRHVAANEPDAIDGLRILTTTEDWPAPPFLASPRLQLAAPELQLADISLGGLNRIETAIATTYDPLIP